MTDQTLWVKYKIQPDRINRGQTEAYRKASPADLLTALLKAVEEGTIEEGSIRSLWSWNEKGTRKVMEPGTYLVVPVREEPK